MAAIGRKIGSACAGRQPVISHVIGSLNFKPMPSRRHLFITKAGGALGSSELSHGVMLELVLEKRSAFANHPGVELIITQLSIL